jgi:hypothetical protein
MLIKISTSSCLETKIAGRSHNIRKDNISFEREKQFQYLETNLRDQTSIQEKIKSRAD